MLNGTPPPTRDLALPSPPPAPPPILARQESFASVISRADHRPGARTREEKARSAAEDLVAITFIQPVLKQVRESTGGAAPFAPTDAERRFGTLMDAELARRVVRSAGFSLVDRLARDLLTGGVSQGPPAPGAPGANAGAAPVDLDPSPFPGLSGLPSR